MHFIYIIFTVRQDEPFNPPSDQIPTSPCRLWVVLLAGRYGEISKIREMKFLIDYSTFLVSFTTTK